MGIAIEQYRASIGRFNCCKFTTLPYQDIRAVIHLFFTLIFVYFMLKLLLSGDIHLNPGPNKSLSICQANVRGLKRDELLDIKASLAGVYDIICITETHLHQASTVDLNILGYQPIIRGDRKELNSWGGVAVYVSDNVMVKRRMDLERNSIEAIWLECRTANNKLLLCCTYRPPNMPVSYWHDLQLSFDLGKQSSIHNMMITGDLNSDENTNPLNFRHMMEFTRGESFNNSC